MRHVVVPAGARSERAPRSVLLWLSVAALYLCAGTDTCPPGSVSLRACAQDDTKHKAERMAEVSASVPATVLRVQRMPSRRLSVHAARGACAPGLPMIVPIQTQ